MAKPVIHPLGFDIFIDTARYRNKASAAHDKGGFGDFRHVGKVYDKGRADRKHGVKAKQRCDGVLKGTIKRYAGYGGIVA